ncbi:MAG: hypothetical protein ABID54_11810 [Pseudomonadota bacterium]
MTLEAYFCFAFVTHTYLPLLPAFIFTVAVMAILGSTIEISL